MGCFRIYPHRTLTHRLPRSPHGALVSLTLSSHQLIDDWSFVPAQADQPHCNKTQPAVTTVLTWPNLNNSWPGVWRDRIRVKRAFYAGPLVWDKNGTIFNGYIYCQSDFHHVLLNNIGKYYDADLLPESNFTVRKYVFSYTNLKLIWKYLHKVMLMFGRHRTVNKIYKSTYIFQPLIIRYSIWLA